MQSALKNRGDRVHKRSAASDSLSSTGDSHGVSRHKRLNMVNWEKEDVKQWKKEAREQQLQFYEKLGDRRWDFIEKKDWIVLQRRVGYALCGPPLTEDNAFLGYSEEQYKLIDKICNIVGKLGKYREKNQDDVWIAFLFINMKMKEKRMLIPVFKVLKSTTDDLVDQCFFVDFTCRVYDSWTDFLKKNRLPRCLYCYPQNGTYTADSNGEVELGFDASPACDVDARILSIFDGTNTVLSIAGTVVGLASLAIPVAGPVVAGAMITGIATGVYGAGRSVQTLVDRGTHGQSIGLKNSEARGCWLGVVGSTLCIASGQAVRVMSDMAKSGEILCTSGRLAVTVLSGASLSVNGIGIVNGAANLYEKARNNQLTPLDVFQFTASVLFFTNSIVNIKTANGIIEDVQRNVLTTHEERIKNMSPEQQNAYKELLTSAPDAKDGRIIHENARIIKGISIIEVKGNFGNPSNALSTAVDKVVHEAEGPTIIDAKGSLPLKGDESHAPLNALATSTLLKKTVELPDREGPLLNPKESLLAAGDLLNSKAEQALQFNELYPVNVPDTRPGSSIATSSAAKTILTSQKPTSSSDQPKPGAKKAGGGGMPKPADKTAHIAQNFSRYLTPEERLHEEMRQKANKEEESQSFD